jgi:UDP-N-acetylmuramate dehydrogenase
MTTAPLIDRLTEALPQRRGRLLAEQPLGPLTWFRVGGPAEVLYTPADEADLGDFLRACPADVPVYPLGVGSNMIIRDGGVRGVVVRLSPKAFGQVAIEGEEIVAGAAALDKRVAEAAAEAGLGGLAFLFGIPGTIGGALTMNAGANGGETKDVLLTARGVTRDGRVVTLSNADLGFAYRKAHPPTGFIFTQARFRGRPEPMESIRAQMAAVQHHRETAQPIREKTGGSTFKNPPGHSAWKLIDAAGCRGLTLGGAQVSTMHCNFLINTGSATAAEIEALGEEVRRRVKDHSGVALEWEIKRVGEPS